MFKQARIKLTVWYLAIIMGVSLSFSGVIFVGVNRELTRLEDFQKTRIQGIIRGFPIQVNIPPGPDTDAINEARLRIITTLGFINVSILILAGLGGYFLAGQTLDPIKKMVDDQKEFVSNASHELRTPLTSLMTEIEVTLRDKHLQLPEAKRMLASNLEEVKKMNNLSNYLLKLNKLEHSTATAFKKVDLKKVILTAIAKVTPLAKASKVKLTTKLTATTITGNEDLLTELVTILVDNAVKYSKRGGSVNVSLIKSSLNIVDHGIGISSRDLPHIFDRFYRADYSRSKEHMEGYGLGLAIAKSIVDLHHATISVTSKVDKGTTFTVIF